MSDIFERLGLRPIVNLSGTETVMGASPVCAEVVAAVNELVPRSVIMAELQSVASQTIARAYGTEAGCVTGCSAAGIAVAIAACMTGRDLALVEQLPDTDGMKDEVILQRGHNVTWGGHVLQTIRLTGAKPVEIGAATECGAYQLRHAIGPQTACALFVVSHHTVQTGLIDLKTFCNVCHENGVPVVVDGAAEPNPLDFVNAGADVVITSAHKVFAGLTAGVLAGRKDLIQACIYQEKGIGRPMKVGKEGVIGAIAGLERWMALDKKKVAADLRDRLDRGREILEQVDGFSTSLEKDWTSGIFWRLRIDVDAEKCGLSAHEVAGALSALRPSISVRSLYADQGFLQLDLRRVDLAEAERVCSRIVETVKSARGGDADRPTASPADLALESLKKWPLPIQSR